MALYVEALRQALVPGGRLYAGFAPLYNAPWGDHRRLKAPLARIWPWAHRLWPQQWLLRRVGAASLADLGLGGTSTAEYLRIFRECGMTAVSLECNNQRRWYVRALEPLRRTVAHEALTFSIYVVLEKPASAWPRWRPAATKRTREKA